MSTLINTELPVLQSPSQRPQLLDPADCAGCELLPLSTGFAQPEGSGRNKVLIVAEALGERESIESLPLRPSGESGAVLERALRRAGLDRQDFAVHNIINCRPPENRLEGMSYEQSAINHCQTAHFERVVAHFNPAVILALGGVPLRTLTGMAGKNRSVSMLRGFPLHSDKYAVPVVASFHPAFISRGEKRLYPVLIRDIHYALEVAKRGVVKDEKKYVERPTVREALNFYEFLANVPINQDIPVAYDIETLHSIKESDEAEDLDPEATDWDTVIQMQFSCWPGTAIAFPFQGEYVEIAKRIMALPNPKWGWNTRIFDDPILRRNGFVINGERIDVMNAWHHIQPDLFKKLQQVASFYCPEIGPWKDMNQSDPEFYGCCDVDAVQRIGVKLFPQLKQQGIYEVRDLDGVAKGGYLHHVQRLTTEVLDPMQRRGMPVDKERQEELRLFIEARMEGLDREIQSRVPDEIKTWHPANGFVNEPKMVAAAIERWASEPWAGTLEECIKTLTGLVRRTFLAEVQTYLVSDCTECGASGRVPGAREGKTKKCGVCKGEGRIQSKSGKVGRLVERWCEPVPFTVNGPFGLLRYMRHKGHTVPIDRKTKKPTTDKESLQKLAKKTGDNFYSLTTEYRELGKTASTYLWELDRDGFVHTTFTTNPATGQLSSVRPNIQNIPAPKHEQGSNQQLLAEKIRATVRAKPGHKIVNFDYGGFHIITLGVLCGSKNLVRLARIDAHSFITAHALKLENRNQLLALPDGELKVELSKIKKAYKSIRDAKIKPCLLGINLGMGPNKFHSEVNKHGKAKMTLTECINLHGTIHSLFPEIKPYQNKMRRQAHEETFLKSHYGYLRRFWEVFRWDVRKSEWVPGDDSEAAIAFYVQNLAHGRIKDAMLETEEEGFGERFQMFNQVHDSLMFHCPMELVDECIAVVKPLMEKPSAIYKHPEAADSGLWCGIEVQVGDDWNSLEEVCV